MNVMWRIGAAAIALAVPAVAFAQEADRQEDIVVTATKKAVGETAQSVPLAITAISGDQLAERNIANLTQLGNGIPSVQMEQAGLYRGSANFSFRGLGATSSIPTVESTVGVFIDGIYIPTPQGVMLDLFDLASVEVLRGPQGTLFGKNVTGGAVLIRSRNPSETFGTDFRASVETGPEYKVGGSITGPLSSTLSARLTAMYGKDEGWFRDTVTREKRGYSRTYLIRPSLRWSPADGVDTVLKYEYGSIRGDVNPTQNAAFFGPNTFDFSNNFAGLTQLDWHQVTSDTNIAIGEGVLTNVAGYRHVTNVAGQDIDGTRFNGFHTYNYLKTRVISEELRYALRLFSAADLTLGAFYYNSKIEAVEERLLAPIGFQPRSFGGVQDHDAWAVFAQTDVNLAEPLVLTLGGRYAHDRKKASIAVFSGAASRCNFAARTCTYNVFDTNSWDSFSSKVGLRYEFGPDQQIYASWSRAYRAGGYNLRITNPSQTLRFDQEYSSQYEVGVKADFLDDALRINASAYINKVNNLIRDVNATVGTSLGTVQDSRNTADITIKGFEFETRLRPTRHLTFTAFVGYVSDRYDNIRFSLIDLPGETVPVVNAADFALHLPRVSPWNYGAALDLSGELGSGISFVARVDYSHRDADFATDNNLFKYTPVDMLGANLRLTFNDRYSLAVFGRNLINRPYRSSIGPLPANLQPSPLPVTPPNTFNYGSLEEGRTVGVEVTAKW